MKILRKQFCVCISFIFARDFSLNFFWGVKLWRNVIWVQRTKRFLCWRMCLRELFRNCQDFWIQWNVLCWVYGVCWRAAKFGITRAYHLIRSFISSCNNIYPLFRFSLKTNLKQEVFGHLFYVHNKWIMNLNSSKDNFIQRMNWRKCE